MMFLLLSLLPTRLANKGSFPPLRLEDLDLERQQFFIVTNDGKIYNFQVGPERLLWVSDLGMTLNEIRTDQKSSFADSVRPDMNGEYYYFPGDLVRPVRIAHKDITKLMSLCPYFAKLRHIEYTSESVLAIDTRGRSHALESLSPQQDLRDYVVVKLSRKVVKYYDPVTLKEHWSIVSSAVELSRFGDYLLNHTVTVQDSPRWSVDLRGSNVLAIKNNVDHLERELAIESNLLSVYYAQNNNLLKLSIAEDSSSVPAQRSYPSPKLPSQSHILSCLEEYRSRELPASSLEYVSTLHSQLFLGMMGLSLALLSCLIVLFNSKVASLTKAAEEESRLARERIQALQQQVSKAQPKSYSMLQQQREGPRGSCFRACFLQAEVLVKSTESEELALQDLNRYIREINHPFLQKILFVDKQGGKIQLGKEIAEQTFQQYIKGFAPHSSFFFPAKTLVEIIPVARGLLDALHTLHSNGIIHGNIGVNNILSVDNRLRIVDSLYSRKERGTKKDDLMRLGVVLLGLFTGDAGLSQTALDAGWAKHYSTAKSENPLLYDFLRRLVERQEDLQWSSEEALGHPLFWEQNQWQLFIQEFSNLMESTAAKERVRQFQQFSQQCGLFRGKWSDSLEDSLVAEFERHRAYDFCSARDLIRVVRNKVSHFHELSEANKRLVGGSSSRVVGFFIRKFPRLPYVTYRFKVDFMSLLT